MTQEGRNIKNQWPEQPAQGLVPQNTAQKQTEAVGNTQVPTANSEAQIYAACEQRKDEEKICKVDQPGAQKAQKVVHST